MDYEIAITNSAKRDLEQIANYITDQLFNPSAAFSILEKFYKQVERLRNNPHIYPLSQNQRLTEKGCRRMPISGTNYLALYKIDESAYKIFILRIFYMRQQYENLL